MEIQWNSNSTFYKPLKAFLNSIIFYFKLLFLNRLSGNCCCEFKANEISCALDKKKIQADEPTKKKLQEVLHSF